MNTRRILILLALPLFLGAAGLLITGSPLLVRPLLGNPTFPAGTLITWLGITALPLTIYAGISSLYSPTTRAMTIYRNILIGVICLAASWGVVSYFLAGNWSFSFSADAPGFRGSPRASWYFWFYSYLTGAAPIVFLLILGLHQMALLIIRSLQRKNSTP